MNHTMKRTLSTLLCLLMVLTAPIGALGEFVFSGEPASDTLLPPRPDSASQLDGGLLLTEKATPSPSPSPTGKPTASPAVGSPAWQLLQQNASASPSASPKAKATLAPSALAGFMLSEWVLELPALEGLLPSVEKGPVDYGAPLVERPVYPESLEDGDPFATYDSILGAGEGSTELTTYETSPADPEGILLDEGQTSVSQPQADAAGGLLLPSDGAAGQGADEIIDGLLLPGAEQDGGSVTEARPDIEDILLPPGGNATDGDTTGDATGTENTAPDVQAGFEGAGVAPGVDALDVLPGEAGSGQYMAGTLEMTGAYNSENNEVTIGWKRLENGTAYTMTGPGVPEGLKTYSEDAEETVEPWAETYEVEGQTSPYVFELTATLPGGSIITDHVVVYSDNTSSETLVLTGSRNGDAVNLSWTSISGVTQYKLTGPGITAQNEFVTGNSANLTVSDPSETDLTYTVTTVNFTDSKELSDTLTIVGNPATSPEKPTDVEAAVAPSGDAITVSWISATSGATYSVYRNGEALQDDITESTYNDSTAMYLTENSYTVMAHKDGESSDMSEASNAVAMTPSALEIAGKAWDDQNDTLSLTWAEYAPMASSRITGLWVSTDDENVDDVQATATGASISDLTPGETYTFTVHAYVGETTNAHEVSTAEYTVPNQVLPTFSVDSVTADKITITVQAAGGDTPTKVEAAIKTATGTYDNWEEVNMLDGQHQFTGLSASTVYELAIRATYDASPVEGMTAQAETLPAAPTDVSVTVPENTSGTLQLEWTAPDGQKVRVVRTPAGGAAETLVEATGTSYTDNTATPGVTMTYAVYAVANSQLGSEELLSAAGTVADGASLFGIALLGVPNKPDVAYDDESETVAVSWNRVNGADYYRVQYSANGTDWLPGEGETSIEVAQGDAPITTALTDLAPGDYTVRVAAGTGTAGSVNYGTYSSESDMVTVPAPAAAVDTVNAVDSGNGSAAVSWTMADGTTSADGYAVYAVADGDDWADAQKQTPAENMLAVAFDDLTANVAYTFYVVPNADTKPATIEGLKSAALTLYAPVLTDVSINSLTEIALSWTAPNAAAGAVSGYRIMMSEVDSAAETLLATLESTKTSDTITLEAAAALKPSTEYTFAIVANYGTTDVPRLSARDGEITQTSPPAPVTLVLTATAGTEAIELTWTNVTGATGYRLTREGANDPLYVGEWKEKHEDLYTGLEAGTEYSYTVEITGGTGEGTTSEVATAEVPESNAPSLTATAGADRITLTWDDTALTSGESITVKRRIDMEEQTLGTLATIAYADLSGVFAEGTYTYADETAVPGVPYRYQVERVNGTDTTTSNETDPATIAVTVGEMNVQVDAEVDGVDGFYVSWDSAGNAVSSYRVQYKHPDGEWTDAQTVAADASGLTAVVKPTNPDFDAEYQIRVVPMFKDGDVEVPGVAQETAGGAQALVPMPLNVSASFDGEKVTVKWDWEPGDTTGTSFMIYREEVGAATARRFSLFASAIAEAGLDYIGTAEDATEYIDNSVEQGKSYRYTVSAGGVKSSLATEAVSTTYAAPPGPTGLTASEVTGSVTSIRLDWTAPTTGGAETPTHYELTRSYGLSTPTNTMVTDTIPIADTSYTDTGVVPNIQFTYTLRSYYLDSGNAKVYSENPPTAQLRIGLPASPVVTATAQGESVLLSWTGGDAFQAASFNIYARKSADVTGTAWLTDNDRLTNVNGDQSSVTLKAGDGTSGNTLEAGVEYVFVVLPVYPFEGSTSAIPFTPYPQATATVPNPSVTDPFGLRAVVSGNQVTLTWTVPAITGTVTGLQVMRRTSTGTETQVGQILAANANMTVDTSVPVGTYTYYVQAVPTTLNIKSAEVSVNVTGTTPTGDRPTNVQVRPTAIDTVQLTWTGVANVTDYIIERSTSQDTGYTQVGTVQGATTYNDNTITPNTLYYYRVIGVILGGNTPASDVVIGFVPLTLRNVVNATRDGKKIKLEWAYPQYATHVTIERATKEEGPYENHALVTAGASPTPYASASATPTAWPWPTATAGWNWGGTTTTTIATSYTDENNVKSGTTYYYRVTPVYAAADKTIIGIPGFASVRAGGSGSGSSGGMTAKRTGYTTIALTWNESTNVSGYAIERAIGSGAFTEIGVSQTASYVDENALPTPEQIRYRVTPYTGEGEQRSMGSVSGSATVANELSAVSGIRAADESSGAGTMISWNAVGGATEYHIYARGNDSSPWQLMGVTFGNASTSFFNQGQQVSGAYRYFVEAVSRPAHASSATYAAAAQAGAALSRRPDGSWLLEYQAGGQVSSVPFTAADAQGQAAIALSFANSTFALTGMGAGSASTPDTVAIWPLEGADIIEPNIRFSKASSIVP